MENEIHVFPCLSRFLFGPNGGLTGLRMHSETHHNTGRRFISAARLHFSLIGIARSL